MKRRRTPKPITTELLDRLTYDAIVPAYSVLSRLGLHCSRSKYFWDSQRRNAIARIHRTSAPQRRHKAAEVAIEELIRVIDFLNERVEGLNRENQNLKAQGCRTRRNWVEERWEAKYAEVQSRLKEIQSENEHLSMSSLPPCTSAITTEGDSERKRTFEGCNRPKRKRD